MTNTDLKAQIDAQITNETENGGITPTDVGSNMKLVVDYVDQEQALKAPITSPSFIGTVSGVTKSMVGLGNVDNTSDLSKPVSTATQGALDLKAPLVSPTFTGTVSGITKSMVGLGNVDNTSDLSKPVSTATQSALDLKADISKTIGIIEIDNVSLYQELSYDFNKIITSGSTDKAVLPATTIIGKEVVVFAMNNGASFAVRANQAGGALLSPNGVSSLSTSVSIAPNVSYRFIHLGDSYWKAELI